MNINQTFTKLFQLLSKEDRKIGVRLLFLVSIMGIFEAAGIASIMPFLAIIGNPNIVNENQILSSLYYYLNSNFTWVDSIGNFLIVLGFSSFIFTLGISFLRIYTLYKMNKYIETCRCNLSISILKIYLDQSYEFFLGRHSGELTKNMLSEVDHVVIEVLRPTIIMISYVFVLLAIIVLLIWSNPVLAIASIGAMAFLYLAVYFSLRQKLAFYGDLQVASNKTRFTSAIEAIGGIKSIKLFGVEKIYLDSFHESATSLMKAIFHFQIFNQIPKHLLEALAFGGIILITIILLFQSDINASGSLGGVLPLLGLYALAAYRSQPALTSIYSGFIGLRYGEAAVINLYNELNNNNFIPKTSVRVKKRIVPLDEIRLDGINYRFPNSEKFALQDINLSIKVGSSIGIIGGSGAGKTTFVDLILGLL